MKSEFPIMTWYGPNLERYHRKSMGYVAEAGFNVAYCILRRNQLTEALAIAHDVGVKLLVGVEDTTIWRTPGCVNDAWLERMRDTIQKVRNHPAFYGYMIADEPVRMMFDDIGRAYKVCRELDPDHMFYVNHWAVGQTYQGARSYEDMWESLYAVAQIDLVSADQYPVKAIPEEEMRAHAGEANYFPRHKAKLHPHYFEMLDLQRQYARQWQKPMWAFTYAKGELLPETAEGEMRFQLMTALAYGAVGLQYFAYEHQNMLMEDDGTPARYWPVAQKLNRLVHTWGPIFLGLRSIGVYHHPANFPYTRPLDQFLLGAQTDMFSRGDAIVVGHFCDAAQRELVFIVNRNPFEPAVATYSFGTNAVEECSPIDAKWNTIDLLAGNKRELYFQPGEGRLYRFTRKIASS
ncbi:MAG: hypothetical protein PCFJNLEI_02125 [Verrucomicrobiae bacterium]|nr:hypothetical protein [Verrucomicrobiae bacterium]